MTESEVLKIFENEVIILDCWIEHCKDIIADCETEDDEFDDDKERAELSLKDYTERKEAFDIAISALKEIQQYREIGTVEECRKAMEKQIPKKPVCKPKPYNESVGFNEEWFCPSCGAYIGYFYEGMDEPEQMEYCNECGQHIARDWSDESEDE